MGTVKQLWWPILDLQIIIMTKLVILYATLIERNRLKISLKLMRILKTRNCVSIRSRLLNCGSSYWKNQGKYPEKCDPKRKKSQKSTPKQVNSTPYEYSEYETDSENESNDSDHQNNEDPEEIAEMKKQLQEEKTRLENNHNLVKSERDRLLRAANEKI